VLRCDRTEEGELGGEDREGLGDRLRLAGVPSAAVALLFEGVALAEGFVFFFGDAEFDLIFPFAFGETGGSSVLEEPLFFAGVACLPDILLL